MKLKYKQPPKQKRTKKNQTSRSIQIAKYNVSISVCGLWPERNTLRFISMHLILPFDDVVDNQSNYTYHMMVDFFHLSPNIVELNLFIFSKNSKYMKLYRFTSMMMECNWIFRLENSIFCYGSMWNHVWEVFFSFHFCLLYLYG